MSRGVRERAVLVLGVLLLVGNQSLADYLVVDHAATIKAAPSGDAFILQRPAKGTLLPLLEEDQTNGYYHVAITTGLSGR